MNTKFRTSLIAGCVLAVASILGSGCAGQNANINPKNLARALSQDNANDSLTVVSPYGNLVVNRTMPGAKDTSPVSTPLTADEATAIAADPIASYVLGLAKDSASVDFEYKGLGGVVTFHRSMPPNTNNPGPLILTVTNTVVTPPLIITNTVELSPGKTNTVISQVRGK